MLTGGVCRGAKRARGGPARQIDEVDDDGRGWGRRPAATSRGTPAQPSACIRCRRGRRCSSTSSRAPGRLVATSTVTARRWRSDDRGGKRASEEDGEWGLGFVSALGVDLIHLQEERMADTAPPEAWMGATPSP